MKRKFSWFAYSTEQNPEDSEEYKIPVNLGISFCTRYFLKKGEYRNKLEKRYSRLGYEGLLKGLDDYGFTLIIYFGKKQYSLDWRVI